MSQTLVAGFSPVNIDERRNLGVRAGDTVRVHQKIKEKDKIRLQVFEGLVLAVKHGGEPGATFTVRRVASGVGVERIFPLYSPTIDKIEIVRRSKVRRSKLYYIRDKVAREIRRQMRNSRLVDRATMSEAEEKARASSAAALIQEEAEDIEEDATDVQVGDTQEEADVSTDKEQSDGAKGEKKKGK
jgi:large subunit ribosomal protein L19